MSDQATATPNVWHPVVFTGKKLEYTKLWLVNFALSILTLGIYSAWAKVRNTQYLYSHLSVDKSPLRYHAKPLNILLGRVIAVIALGVLVFLQMYSALGIALAQIIMLFLFPWLIIQGLRFNLRMTSYRNIRFSFTGKYWPILGFLILYPFAMFLSLGLAIPYLLKVVQEYLHRNVSYGGKQFSCNLRASKFYIAALCVIGVFILILIGSIILGAMLGINAKADGPAGFNLLLSITMAINYILIYTFSKAVWDSIIRNHVYESTELEGIAKFKSEVNVFDLAVVLLGNSVLLALTLGLAYPVVQIRIRQYLCSVSEVELSSELDQMVNTIAGDDQAIGEEVGSMLDADIGLLT